MDIKEVVEIVDKHVEQEALVKELGMKYVMPMVESKLALLDPIPGMTWDNELIAKLVEKLKEALA